MKDFCGQLGSVYTNPMITLPRSAVSTFVPLSYFYEEGQEWFDPGVMGMPGTINPLDLADLACPTFGVGKFTAPDGTVKTTYGAPYLPIIIPPKQLTTLDPVWHKSCTEILSVGEFLKSFAIVDPPRILQPAAALGPTSPAEVPAIETPILQPVIIKPNASPVPNTGKILPAATAAPDNNRESTPKDSNPADPKLSLDSNVPNPDVNQPGNRPSADPTNLNMGNPILKPQDPDKPLANPKEIDTQRQKLAEPLASNSKAVKTPSASPGQPNDPNLQQSSGPNLGELIINALNGVKLGSSFGSIANSGQAGSDDSGGTGQNNRANPAPQNPPPQNPKPFPIAGQAFTAKDPSTAIPPMPSKTLIPGETAINVNAPPSIGAPGTPFVYNAPVFPPQPGPAQGIPTFAPAQSPGVFVAAGLLFTPLPSSQGVAIYGKTLVPGGSVVTFSEVPASLDLSGRLHVGSSLFAVPTPAVPEVIGGVFSAAGFAFTSLPSSEGLAINGQTLVPGGAPATVSRTHINFDPTGALYVGSLLTPLPTPAPNSVGWVMTANGLTFTFLSSANGVVIDSQTLVPGGFSATVSGTRIILDSTSGLHVGSSLIYLPILAAGSVGVVFTAGGLTFTSLSSANGVVINDQTLAAGGLPITLSGERISLDPTEGLHVGFSLIALPTQVPSSGNAVFIARGLKFTALPSLRVAIDGQTLAPGSSPVTVLGTCVSLDPTGGLRVGSWLIAHSTQAPGSGVEIYSTARFPPSRLPHLELVISGITILPSGATATISGTPMSLDPSETLFEGTTSVAFYSSPTGSNSSVVVLFLGQGSRVKGPPCGCLTWLVGVVSGMFFLIYWV